MLKSFFIFCTAISSLVFANEKADLIVNQNLIYQQIIEQQPDAVFFCTEDKIYLKPEKILPTDRGLYVGNIGIHKLYSDASGCWLQKPMNYWICQNPDCTNYQKVYRSSSRNCPLCKLPGTSG